MIMQIEKITSEDEHLRMYGTFMKIKTNRYAEQKGDDSNLSETDLQEIADLIEISEVGFVESK